ncbi:MAG: glyoxalase [Pseudonocardia sp. SCN 72-86]|nr:MAG: glyoxalase [Pseudonocardia sp. SCN 72-86]
MTFRLEVAVVPVSNLDKALEFYVDKFGFNLDVDYRPTDDFAVVQLTPPGSECSIHLQQTPGDNVEAVTHYLVVDDIQAAQRELAGRGAPVADLRHKSPLATWSGGFADGPDPERRDYATFADVTDPDGNLWVLQERGFSSATP